MERINRILRQDSYRKYLEENNLAERERKFCRHDMSHFLDVARIAMILNREDDYGIPGEMIYAAALLHDIGRFLQYEKGTPHEQASFQLAPAILEDCGFSEQEKEKILSAILHHRNKEISTAPTMDGLIYRADKMSRTCYACDVEPECDWDCNKKNRILMY